MADPIQLLLSNEMEIVKLNMNKKNFIEKIYDAVGKKLQGTCRVELKKVRKNNGVIMHGLMISSEDENVIPTIYLDHFYEEYIDGTPLSRIVENVLEAYSAGCPRSKVNMDFYNDFNAVKERICYRLIRKKGNEELLMEIPYVEFLDLAICFYYAFQNEELGEGSILIYLTHAKKWNVTEEQLLDLAIDNTQRLFPEMVLNMEDMIHSLSEDDEDEETEKLSEPCEIPMVVLTNDKKSYGAVSMLYPDVLEKFSKRFGESFYIIPSSVHEVIIMNQEVVSNPEHIKNTIYEVNRDHVAPDEVLSDNLYFYNRQDKTVSIV